MDKAYISSIHILGAYRDGLESGKPQLLFYAGTELSAEKVVKNFVENTTEKLSEKINTKKKYVDRKLRKRIKAEMKVIKDGSKLVWIRKDLLPKLQFNIDGIKFSGDANGKEGFFEIKKNGKIKSLKKQSLYMVPSASASVVMFNNFLAKKNTM